MKRSLPLLFVASCLLGMPGLPTVVPSPAEDAAPSFRTIEIGVPDMH